MKKILVWLLYVVITSLLAALINDLTGLQIVGSQFACVTHNVTHQMIGLGTLYILLGWRAV